MPLDLTAILLSLAGWIPQIGPFLREKHLTGEEKTLLKMGAYSEGRIWVFETDQTNEFVKIGSHALYDEENPETQADSIEAVQRLVRLVSWPKRVIICIS